MAAPPEMTTLNLTGTFTLNKTKSDDTDEILRLQGISWMMRKLIQMTTLTLYVKQYKDDTGNEHIDIQQMGSGGFKGNFEARTLDWEEHHVEDPFFGPVVGKNRRVKIEDVENPYHKEGWLQDTYEHGAIQTQAWSDTPKSGKTWRADVIWGFADIDGERKHTRRVQFYGPEGEDIKCRMVYDYVGPNDED